jgi:hypothetical protein
MVADYNSGTGVLTMRAQDNESADDPVGFKMSTYNITVEAEVEYSATVAGTTISKTITATTSAVLRARSVDEI